MRSAEGKPAFSFCIPQLLLSCYTVRSSRSFHHARNAAFLNDTAKINWVPARLCCFSRERVHTLNGELRARADEALRRFAARRCACSRLGSSPRHPAPWSFGQHVVWPPGRWHATPKWPYIPRKRGVPPHAPCLSVASPDLRPARPDFRLSSSSSFLLRWSGPLLRPVRLLLRLLAAGGRPDSADRGAASSRRGPSCSAHGNALRKGKEKACVTARTVPGGNMGRALGHGPIGHGIATKPAEPACSPDYPLQAAHSLRIVVKPI
jgi:hypothetical protein